MGKIPKNKRTFWTKNSLLIVFVSLTLISLVGQTYTGWLEHNEFLKEKGAEALGLWSYLSTGHFVQATFENWESEFLQMGLFIILTVSLYQQGSSESKSMDEDEPVEREPVPTPNAPWPVKKGGLILKFYENSLSLAFILLFFLSWAAHFYGSLKEHNTEEILDGKQAITAAEFIAMPKFWFETFQNWQSEFLAVASIVFFSIYLRQKGSAQSKPVDTPHDENE
jgi:hypothetical protein